ncbi:MAG: ATP-dependent helicase [Acetatifactor sp.]|nr:ATP-dependent helicase [Acetatifactor sp.]
MLDLVNLNPSQLEAVTHREGPALVLAGPGSGKTVTIIQHVYYLVEKYNVSPKSILVLTFSKEAALLMEKRFMSEKKTYSKPNFATFHSLFFNILKSSKKLMGYKLASTPQKIKLLRYALKDHGLYFSEDKINIILNAIGFYKNTGRTPTDIEIVEVLNNFDFIKVLKRLNTYMLREKLIDYDDMIYYCRIYLESDPAALKELSNRYRYLLIDEFQDINPGSYEICKLIAHKGNIFAVGDDDQSIYSFRGSDPECIKRFVHDFNPKKIILNINYRSVSSIVERSQKLIRENRNRFDKDLISFEKMQSEMVVSHGSNIGFKILKAEDKKTEFDMILKSIFSGDPDKNINVTNAILFRTNKALLIFAYYLEKKGIYYVTNEKLRPLSDNFLVKDVLTYIKVAKGERSVENILGIINKPERGIPREIFYDGFDIFNKEQREKLLSDDRKKADEFVRDMEMISGMKPYQALNMLFKALGYEKYINKKSYRERSEAEDVKELIMDMARGSMSLEEFINNLEKTDENILSNNPHRGKKCSKIPDYGTDKHIYLYTIHSSKGLEFDNVFIPDCNEGVFPHPAGSGPEYEQEERRLFYVAMTRAKKSLSLYYISGSGRGERLISRFLNRLM